MSKLLTPEELAELHSLNDNVANYRKEANEFAPTNYMSYAWREVELAENRRNNCAGLALRAILDHIEALNATIAARDQWADQLTEQYAAREVEVKFALKEMIRPSDDTSTDYASRMRNLYHNQEIRIAAARLNITLD